MVWADSRKLLSVAAHGGAVMRDIAKVPTIHIPVGFTRNAQRKVVIWSAEETAKQMSAWCDFIRQHPDSIAAGACVTVGPTQTTYLNPA
jgi:hypothetical protein